MTTPIGSEALNSADLKKPVHRNLLQVCWGASGGADELVVSDNLLLSDQ